MKEFDEKFRDNVKEVFGNYDAGHLSDEGWKSFSSRRGRKEHMAIFIPLWAKAASVILLVTAGSLITYHLLKEPSGNLKETAISRETEMKPQQKEITAKAQSPSGAVEVNSSPGIKGNNLLALSGKKHVSGELPSEGDTGVTVKDNPVDGPDVRYKEMADTVELKEVIEERGKDEIEDQNRIYEEAVKELHAGDTLQVPEEENQNRVRRSSVMAGISGMIAAIDNEITGSPGFSAGFYYEYKLSKRIAVRPGLALAMHSSTVEKSSVSSAFDYAAPLSDGTTGVTDSYNAHLNLVALEMPVNVVFRIIDREKSSLFLSAGASTMVFLSQSFTGTFINSYTKTTYSELTGGMTADTRYSTTTVEKNEGAFSHTDLMGLANFSAGYSVPFGKGSLLLEPYIQLPLGNISSLDLKIIYSGMSFKMRFGR